MITGYWSIVWWFFFFFKLTASLLWFQAWGFLRVLFLDGKRSEESAMGTDVVHSVTHVQLRKHVQNRGFSCLWLFSQEDRFQEFNIELFKSIKQWELWKKIYFLVWVWVGKREHVQVMIIHVSIHMHYKMKKMNTEDNNYAQNGIVTGNRKILQKSIHLCLQMQFLLSLSL